MNREDALRYTGSIQQLAYVRPMMYLEGRAAGMRAVEVKNGVMRFVSMVDKCMDVALLEYKGVQLSFLSKPGLIGRNPFDTHGEEAQRSIMGGLFFTCGFENICAPYVSDKEYPMHGRLRTTPAEQVGADAYWDGDDYVLTVTGQMCEAELFGEHLELRRRIRTVYGTNRIEITDTAMNRTSRAEPMMLMYHCNFGFPFLNESAFLVLPSLSVTGRDDWSQAHLGNWSRMEPPVNDAREYVFQHTLAAGEDGQTFAAIVNPQLELGVRIDYNKNVLPYFMEWKSLSAGDYVLGMEPSNSSVYGRKFHEQRNCLHRLPPYGQETVTWSFTVLDGNAAIEQTILEAERLRDRACAGASAI